MPPVPLPVMKASSILLATSRTILSRSAASRATTDERASSFEKRVMLLSDFTPSSSRTSPKSGSTSVISSFSPCQAGAPMLTRLGMRTTPAAVTSKIRGPAARKTDACSSGLTRMRCTCSAVSSGWLTVDEAMGVSRG